MDVLIELETALPLRLAANLSQWPLEILQTQNLRKKKKKKEKEKKKKKPFPCGPESIVPLDAHYKKNVCKTVGRTPTANKVNYDSFIKLLN